jgi:hypothetical protein
MYQQRHQLGARRSALGARRSALGARRSALGARGPLCEVEVLRSEKGLCARALLNVDALMNGAMS